MENLNIYPARSTASQTPTHHIPPQTRNHNLHKVIYLYSSQRSDQGVIGRGDYNGDFWNEINRRILYRTGGGQLGSFGGGREAFNYLLNCSGKEFLVFLEDIFSADAFFHVRSGDYKLS